MLPFFRRSPLFPHDGALSRTVGGIAMARMSPMIPSPAWKTNVRTGGASCGASCLSENTHDREDTGEAHTMYTATRSLLVSGSHDDRPRELRRHPGYVDVSIRCGDRGAKVRPASFIRLKRRPSYPTTIPIHSSMKDRPRCCKSPPCGRFLSADPLYQLPLRRSTSRIPRLQ